MGIIDGFGFAVDLEFDIENKGGRLIDRELREVIDRTLVINHLLEGQGPGFFLAFDTYGAFDGGRDFFTRCVQIDIQAAQLFAALQFVFGRNFRRQEVRHISVVIHLGAANRGFTCRHCLHGTAH